MKHGSCYCIGSAGSYFAENTFLTDDNQLTLEFEEVEVFVAV